MSVRKRSNYPKILSIFLIFNGLFLAWTATSWAYVFSYAIKHGQYVVWDTLYDGKWLKAEMWAGLAVGLFGLASAGYVIFRRLLIAEDNDQ